jgi:hypothetical protein
MSRLNILAVLVAVLSALAVASCYDRAGNVTGLVEYPVETGATLLSNPALSLEARKLVTSTRWVGREHNAAVNAVLKKLSKQRAKGMTRETLCRTVDGLLRAHYASRGAAIAEIGASSQAIEIGHVAGVANAGCKTSAIPTSLSQSVFAPSLFSSVQEDSIDLYMELDPAVELLIQQIANSTYYATSAASLESEVVVAANQGAQLDALGAAIVGAGASTAVDSYISWTQVIDSRESRSDVEDPYSLYGTLVQEHHRREGMAGHLGRADVSGGLAAIMVTCIRLGKIPVACTTPHGLIGIFLAGAAAASLYEWFMS